MCRLGGAPALSVTDAPGETRVTGAQREVSGVSKPTVRAGRGDLPRLRSGPGSGRGRHLARVSRSRGPGGSPDQDTGSGSTQQGDGTWCGPEDRGVTEWGPQAPAIERRAGLNAGRGR